MGLDTVELVMELEDAFGISIPDSEASRMVTVGNTLEYIVRHLRARVRPADEGCPSRRVFHRLRKDLVAYFGPARRSIRPASRIGSLVPAGPLRRNWPQFARANGLPVPPRRLWADRFPDPATTVRDLVRQVALPPYLTDRGEVDEQATWSRVRSIISATLGIAVDEIKLQHRYIDDLNCD